MNNDKKELERKRFATLVTSIWLYKRDIGRRLLETKRLFKRKVFAVDIHSHSNCSDGKGTVQENYEAAMNVGLDFLFATDHGSLKQKRVVRKWKNASWGQEPGAGLECRQCMGLLCGIRCFRPSGRDNYARDFERAKKIAPFVFIPHPVGWYPHIWNDDEKVNTLWTLGDEFAIEVMNGANKIVRAYDEFDSKAVVVWDRLLCAGKRVTALGGSDAHCPENIGSVWTGIYAADCRPDALIHALRAGRCFASEASLLEFFCEKQPMGSVVRKNKGAILNFRFRIADAAGLESVRIISEGKVIKKYHLKGKTVMDGGYPCKVPPKPVYYRLEVTAVDDRRAFSTPIYIRPV